MRNADLRICIYIDFGILPHQILTSHGLKPFFGTSAVWLGVLRIELGSVSAAPLGSTGKSTVGKGMDCRSSSKSVLPKIAAVSIVSSAPAASGALGSGVAPIGL